MKKYNRVLSIAGSDSSGGAGIQADIKTITTIGCFATTAITSITAQNTIGVQRVTNLSSLEVRDQIESVLSDIGTDTVKIGMLGNLDIVESVYKSLKRLKDIPIVFDPVIVSTSGDVLLEDNAINAITTLLFPIAEVITPNIAEAQKLCKFSILTIDDMKKACFKLSEIGAKNILIKGGDNESSDAVDILYLSQQQEFQYFETKKINSANTHGTGCTFSSAIAAYIAKGNSLTNSVQLAKKYIFNAILSGSSFQIGKGHGPVNHNWQSEEK